jgi:HAD superfamily hydrolase (TIGR01509 family)
MTTSRPSRQQSTAKSRPSAEASETPAALFDLDGTLIDTVYEHALAWSEALDRERIWIPDWRIHRQIGMSGRLFLPMLFREIGYKASRQKIDEIENIHKQNFSRRVPRIRPHSGARELLAKLTRLKVRWAIATSGDKKTVDKLIKLLEIGGEVPVITSEDVEVPKPSPSVFAVAAERLNAKLSDSIVVGDSVWDVLSAVRAKALGVGLLCGGYGEAELQEAGAFRVYRDPADLLEHLEEVGVRT